MTQNILPSIDPTLTSGTDLANLLNVWSSAVDSTQIGPTRPVGLPVGGLWINNANPTNYGLAYYNGSTDIYLLAFNPTSGSVNFPGGSTTGAASPNGTTDGTPAASANRTLTGINSIAGGGDLTTNRVFQLSGDQPLATSLPNHYYGRDANNIQGFIPLPTPVLSNHRRGVYYGPGDYTFVNSPTVGSIEIELYAGGSTVWGACAQGYLDLQPGGSFTVHVGAANDGTNFAGVIICGSNGSYSQAANLSGNFSNTAPRRRDNVGNEFGAPGSGGFMRISWNEQ